LCGVSVCVCDLSSVEQNRLTQPKQKHDLGLGLGFGLGLTRCRSNVHFTEGRLTRGGTGLKKERNSCHSNGCISMLRYGPPAGIPSSTVCLLAAEFLPHQTPAHPYSVSLFISCVSNMFISQREERIGVGAWTVTTPPCTFSLRRRETRTQGSRRHPPKQHNN